MQGWKCVRDDEGRGRRCGIDVGRKARSGEGVGILIPEGYGVGGSGSFAANVKWVFVKELGYVEGFMCSSGSFSNDPRFDDIKATTRAAIFKEKGKGELPNRVCGYGEVKRTSDDSVVTPRGKRLIEEMNRVGLIN